MRAIKDRDTKPEMAVRKLLHDVGYRYRLHREDPLGRPDIVFGPCRKVIFVHGRFWHGYSCKRSGCLPKSNAKYWQAKIARNLERYFDELGQLHSAGWTELALSECGLAYMDAVAQRLCAFLDETVRPKVEEADLSMPK